ncbi:hypothetical protein P3H80_04520 [Mycolicibacterium septicum]|uniref:hypothetical protein n=1 Tax=Mycolicibacterium septicum TaxID=98668 RepID=UPI0023E1E8E7|nr:hypothetical protein [Mycolicibacterium septicum]MDF3336669.1 hypothetical protein [Mycolicibacterium septicum]
MNLALRPYVTAGVALVGASVIAVTPVTAPPPAMQSHSIQLSAAIDDPIEVFAPVFAQASTVIQNAIQAEIDDPFPIIVGLAGKLAADGKALGDIANALGQSYGGLVAGLPGALTTYAQKIASGDFTGAVGAFMPIAMGPFFTTFMQLINFQSFVKTQFDVARDLTNAAIMGVYGLGPGQLLSVYGVIAAVTGTLDKLVKAVPTGDPGEIVNVIQHGAANIATAALGVADLWRFSFDDTRQKFRDILNPPPPDPEEEFRTAKVVPDLASSLPSAQAVTLEAPSVETPQPEPEPKAVTEVVSSPDTTATTETTPETKPLVRDSLVAAPGKPGLKTARTAQAHKIASRVSEQVSATANKIGEGIKSALGKPAKNPAAASSGSSRDAK